MTEDPLDTQIAAARQTIATDGYPMSIGELTNLYRDDELLIRPEYQRFFRWTADQKSRLIESILLGIPIPSIFVAQNDKGTWEVVDGLQRLSTIYELQGVLRDEEGRNRPQLKLVGTKYLPSLAGRQWEAEDPNMSLSEPQRLDVKRAKIDIKIIKRESSAATKFDLFERLNSYGSQLNATEMRSALLVASSSDFFAELESLSRNPNFNDSVALSAKQYEERYDIELVTRFLVLHDWPDADLKQSSLRDLPQILDKRSTEMALSYNPETFAGLRQTFEEAFAVIAANGDEDVFRRWDVERSEFRGPFLTSAFEILALGLGYHIRMGSPFRTDLLAVSKELWSSARMSSGYSTGRSTESRLAEFIPMGRDLLAR